MLVIVLGAGGWGLGGVPSIQLYFEPGVNGRHGKARQGKAWHGQRQFGTGPVPLPVSVPLLVWCDMM